MADQGYACLDSSIKKRILLNDDQRKRLAACDTDFWPKSAFFIRFTGPNCFKASHCLFPNVKRFAT